MHHESLPHVAKDLVIAVLMHRDEGADVDEVLLYEARVPAAVDEEALSMVRDGAIDAVTLASSSSVRHLATLLGADFERLRSATVACIGPITAATAREYGLKVSVEPQEQTIEALVEALCEHYARERR